MLYIDINEKYCNTRIYIYIYMYIKVCIKSQNYTYYGTRHIHEAFPARYETEPRCKKDILCSVVCSIHAT